MTRRSSAAWALLLIPMLMLAGTMPARALQAGENLLAPIPDGFKPGIEAEQNGMHLSNFIPVKETTSNWTQMITAQTYAGMSKYQPDQFAQILGDKWKKSCKGGTTTKLSGGVENDYAVATWQFSCPMNAMTKKPETMWMKVIAGGDSFYNVHFSVRLKLSPVLAKRATEYLSFVQVCDTRPNGHPCPQDAGAPAPAPAPAQIAPPVAKPAVPTPAPAIAVAPPPAKPAAQ